MYLILFKLGRVWFSNTITRLIQLYQPREVETRRQPYIIYIGDRCEVRHYKREVLIALVSVLDIIPLAIIYIVVYIYGKWLKVKCFIN